MQTFNTILLNFVAATTVAVVTVPGASTPKPRTVPAASSVASPLRPAAQRVIHGYRPNQVGDFDAGLIPIGKDNAAIFAGAETTNKTVY
jgi:hypothetical protein